MEELSRSTKIELLTWLHLRVQQLAGMLLAARNSEPAAQQAHSPLQDQLRCNGMAKKPVQERRAGTVSTLSHVKVWTPGHASNTLHMSAEQRTLLPLRSFDLHGCHLMSWMGLGSKSCDPDSYEAKADPHSHPPPGHCGCGQRCCTN